MRLVCSKCGVAIPGVDINLARGIGVCRPCGELVAFPATLPADKLYRPADFRFDERVDEQGYVALSRPSRAAVVPMIFFTLFWDAFMAVWYAIAIGNGVWPMALFGLVHLGVAFYLTHSTLVALFNTFVIRITRDRFTYRSGPVAFAGNIDVPLAEVDSFGTVDSSRRTENVLPCVNLSSGKSRKFNLGRSDMASAKFVAASLETP